MHLIASVRKPRLAGHFVTSGTSPAAASAVPNTENSKAGCRVRGAFARRTEGHGNLLTWSNSITTAKTVKHSNAQRQTIQASCSHGCASRS